MKFLLGIVFASCFFTAVRAQTSDKTSHQAKKEKITLSGVIGKLNPPAQLWYYIGSEQWDTIPVKNGVFKIVKETMLPAYGAMMIRYKPYHKDSKESIFSHMNLQNMYYEAGAMIFNSPVDTLKRYLVATGSGSESFNKYMALWYKEDTLIMAQRQLAATFNSASPEQMQSINYQKDYEQKNQEIELQLKQLVIAQIKQDPNSLVSIMAFFGYLKKADGNEPREQIKSVFNLLSSSYRNSENGKALGRAIDGMSLSATSNGESVQPETDMGFLPVGSMMPDFIQNDPSGRPVKLSDYRGKYVLLDFWASWCTPCRSTNRQLVSIYNKYKTKNFDVLGISLDNNKTAWETAIMQDKLYWRQVSDLKGSENTVAKSIRIDAIPMSFLLDPDGRILYKGHGLDEMETVLKTRLDK